MQLGSGWKPGKIGLAYVEFVSATVTMDINTARNRSRAARDTVAITKQGIDIYTSYATARLAGRILKKPTI
jgi:hypothetical protein